MDRLRISRQKLAFIIDSTSAPVAILVPFIGWGVYIMSLIYVEYEALGILESEFTAFVRAIPFQFYAWLAVMMVPLLTFLRFDFGAMATAEKVAQRDPDEDSKALAQDKSQIQYQTFTHPNAKPVLVWAPLIVLAAVLGYCWCLSAFPSSKFLAQIFGRGCLQPI